VAKKMTWEVDKTSLVLKVTGGPKETTWRIRKGINIVDLSQILEDVWLSLQDDQTMLDLAQKLLPPVEAPTWDAEELAELDRYQPVQADSEEASRSAQAARVAQLSAGAKWWDADEEEGYGIPIPDYDSGEI
jgi:hypothetical protein